MTVAATIEQKIADAVDPVHLEVINESHMHNVPPGSESHFKLIIVSDAFDGKRLIGRHQLINATLKAELDGPVHALSMETHTPAEWEARGGRIMASPSCRGGAKHDPAFGN
ncbi:MAG: BolA/IbaG family iron-sulfur metabolism protein [Rhodospirillales bacterium]|nr:BolA/IbaG family iron-sulfur metabolism protein [Rhodospirillales bacterium]